jgi:hypothetical protein
MQESVKTVASNSVKYMLNFMRIHKVREDKHSNELENEYTFSVLNMNANHQLGTHFSVYNGIRSIIERGEFQVMVFRVVMPCSGKPMFWRTLLPLSSH